MTARRAGWRWADVRPHGTVAAYRRHLRHGERACESCLQAGRRAWQDGGYAGVRRVRRAVAREAAA